MNKRQIAARERHVDTVACLRAEKADVGPTALLTQQLDQCCSDLAAAGARQADAKRARGGAVAQAARERRRLRRDFLLPAGTIAKLPEMKHLPGIEPLMTVPHARATTQTLVDAGNTALKTLRAPVVAGAYREKRLGAEFVSAMRDCVKTLVAKDRRAVHEAKQLSLETREVRRQVSKARTIAHAIVATVGARMEKDDRFAFALKNAMRIGARRGRPRKKKLPRTN